MRARGTALAAGMMLMAGAAHAQSLARMGPGMMVASDFDAPYEEVVPAPPSRFAPGYPPPAYPAPPPVYGPNAYAPPVLPPGEIVRIARERGFSPLGMPQQRGLVYTIAVIDLDGEDGRLVIDARNGRIIRFMPAYRYGRRGGDDVALAYGPPAALPPLSMAHPPSLRPPGTIPGRAGTPLPRPRNATVAPASPETTAAVGTGKTSSPAVPPAPTAALAAAPAAAAPSAAKPSVSPQPTQPMPAAQGVE